jgi:hypothetical protein
MARVLGEIIPEKFGKFGKFRQCGVGVKLRSFG